MEPSRLSEEQSVPLAAKANLEMIRRVAERLGLELLSQVVFVGGATIALLLTDPAAPEVRPTNDVDVIVETITHGDYYRLAEKLRARGFVEDQPDAATETPLICRWRVEDLIVDVMPTDEKILGFSNRWYKNAYQSARVFTLPGDNATGIQDTIRLITAPYALATKIEAFRSRGNNDFFASHDLEDIITLIDGRAELADEVRLYTPEILRAYVAAFFNELLNHPGLSDIVEGHLSFEPSEGSRSGLVIRRIRRLAVV